MVSLTSFAFIFSLLLSPTAVQSAALRDGDAAAMKDISAVWNHPKGWTGDDPCEWQGVTCAIVSEGVFFKSEILAVISLTVRGICGSFSEDEETKCILPSSIGSLKYLKHLYLNGNGFHGEIPESFSNLQNLISLYLNANKLTGEIPSSLGNLQALEKLYLNSNQLTGNIPASIGNARNLRQLELQQNELHGPIPDQLSNLRHIVQLDLNGTPPICSQPAQEWQAPRIASPPTPPFAALLKALYRPVTLRRPQTTSWTAPSPRRWATSRRSTA
jgi:hypothetical protein